MKQIRRAFRQAASLFARTSDEVTDPRGEGQRLVVAATAGMVTLVLCLGWLYVAWHDYRAAMDSARQSSSSFALALEEHAQRSFESAFLALERVADRLEGRDPAGWASSRENWEFAKGLAAGLPQIDSILLIDAGGEVRMVTSDFPAPKVNVLDRDYFQAHAVQGQARFLGQLIFGRGSGKPLFTISIRLADRQGKFLGVALASMDIGYFRQFYRSLDLGAKGSAALLRADGRVLVREPLATAGATLDLSRDQLFTEHLPRAPAGVFVNASPFDGQQRMAAYRRAKDLPLVVVATHSMSSLREHAWTGALVSGAAVLLFLVVIWSGVHIQFLAIERESRTRRELAASRDFADTILDSVRSHIAILDEHGVIRRTNRSWQDFGRDNGLAGSGEGTNYLEACRRPGLPDAAQAEEAASGIAGVIMGARESFSLEYPCHSPAEKRWFEMHVTPLRGKPGHVVVSHENITPLKEVEAQLRCLATTDGLTGLENRRVLVERGEAEFARAKRYFQDLALIMLDCDHFKAINDHYGHAVGDRVLMALADRIKATIRETDHAGRIGGEEFAIVLTHTAQEGAVLLAERLREAILASEVLVQGVKVRFTVSLGVSAITPETESFSALLKAADDALYRAKGQGRNRVEASWSPSSTPSN